MKAIKLLEFLQSIPLETLVNAEVFVNVADNETQYVSTYSVEVDKIGDIIINEK